MRNTAILAASLITKRYSAAPVFAPVSCEIRSGEIVAVTGANGTGKSTLLKILARGLSPSKGEVSYRLDEKDLSLDDYQPHIGFAAPYLELYSELTAVEHIQFVADLKKKTISIEQCVSMLVSLGLDEAVAQSERHVKQYSSGMQQRVKLAMAFALAPEFIFLDEPGSNLDANGVEMLFTMIKESASNGALVVIATNDSAEAALASNVIALAPYRKSL